MTEEDINMVLARFDAYDWRWEMPGNIPKGKVKLYTNFLLRNKYIIRKKNRDGTYDYKLTTKGRRVTYIDGRRSYNGWFED